ncbi:class I adenylate-forming enzyme family protein [Arthrobacter sp. NtRootA1]|uniref:class I adenylate-forming enzyme family protein n=1 Tax=Micrococcaceae TaxID=1268 RepID=UPI001CC3DFBE|nr:class I adenylate-forming enzyme family protein [Arthrobacter sp. NtRootA1]BCW05864.1 long-chain-fatty-acid--CoA ligase [Arthrobacter sp. NtRootA1]
MTTTQTLLNPAAYNLGSLVRIGAQRAPNRIAIRMLDGIGVTYAELDDNTNRIANAMLGAGISSGDRVAIWMENDIRYMEAYLACLKAGMVVVQCNVRHTSFEAQHMLDDSGAVALFIDDSTAERVEALENRDSIRLTVTTGANRDAATRGYEGFRASGQPTPPTPISPAPDDLAVLAYTSGTTGLAKGARLTHRSLRSIVQTNQVANRYSIGSTQIFALSLSSSAGIPAHVLPHLAVGGTTILMSNFDTPRLVDAIDRHHATFTTLPGPPIVDFCTIVREQGLTLPSLQSLLHGTAKAPEEHLELLVDAIGPRLVEGWGMTENSGGLVAATSALDYSERRPGIFSSTGRSVPETVVRLIDEHGNKLPHDGSSVGQLIVRSGSLADGYWNNEEASAKAFRNGWYHTGDVGRIDEEGYIEVLDRRTDLIISGGMNIYPSEIERVLLQIPGVIECAVVGVHHEKWGSTPVAYVVRASDVSPSLGELEAVCRRQLASYKQPSRIEFTSALPRNVGGKVMRHRLR